MRKIFTLVFAFSLTATPVFALDEGGCFFSKKNKVNKDATKEQVKNSNSSNK